MPNSFHNPVAVVHQGMALYVVSTPNADTGRDDYYYNVLELQLDSASDSNDWAGYRRLTIPDETSIAGMSLLRASDTPNVTAPFQLVSDEQYVYLFRATERTIRASRYTMVKRPNPELQGDAVYALEPAWEVRFQRSESADVPLNEKDSQSFLDMTGAPFIEPVVELPFGGSRNLLLGRGHFSVLLTRGNAEDRMRWIFIVRDGETNRLEFYSFPRLADGWFDLSSGVRLNADDNVAPDFIVQLTDGGAPLPVVGAPAAATYYRQEVAPTDDHGLLKMKHALRVFVTAEVTRADTTTALATLDFAVTGDGTLAGLIPPDQNGVVTLAVGEVDPADAALSFDGVASVALPTANAPIVLGPEFTEEVWLNPQVTDLGRHDIIGGSGGTDRLATPPSVWITNRRRIGVGFGTGTAFLFAETTADVLTDGTWAHVAAVFDGQRYRVYVNGDEVPITMSGSFAGQTPAPTPLAGLGGNDGFMVGMLDEARVWTSALDARAIRKYLYREIPDDEARRLEDLVGYWRLDEGVGTTAHDSSRYGRDATLVGPRWAPATAPLKPATQAQVYVDTRGFTLYAGVIAPDETAPLFGAITPGSRPFILNSADGLLHLYYQARSADPQLDDALVVAQCDTTVARAYYQAPWTAVAADAGATQTGMVYFAARQTGTVLNDARIEITTSGHPLLCDVTLDDGRGARETWRGVPRTVDDLVRVLRGEAVSEPGDPRVDTGERTFYDVDGTRNIGYVPAGDGLLAGRLGLLSRRLDTFELQEVAVSGAGTGTCSATVSLTADAAHPGERLTRTFRSMPAEITAFANVLDGTAWSYDYGAGGSGDGGGTPVYALPAGSAFVFGFTPNPAVTGAHFSVGRATSGDPTYCDVTIELTIATLGRGGIQTPPGVAVVAEGVAVEDGAAPEFSVADPLRIAGYSPAAQATVVTATWEDVPRTASDFIRTILDGATDPQKRVAAELRLCDNSDDAAVVDADVLTDAGLHPFAALFDVINTATRGAVTDFTCTLGKLQGVTTTGEPGLLRNGSILFAALAPNRPTNGYPAVVDLGPAGTALATVFQAGADGGWLREPPRSAVELRGKGALEIPTTSRAIGRLAVTGAFTIEAWAKTAPIDPTAAAGPSAMFPRVIHANPNDEPNGARYVLGLAPTHTLQFVTGTMIQADDSAVPAGLTEQRLFPYRDYTIQCYIRPNLETITPGSPAPIALRRSATNPTVSERLEIDAAGILALVVTQEGGQQARYAAQTSIATNEWTMVTLARQGDALALYTGPALNAAFTGTLEITAEHSTLTLGGSVAASPFEMEMNQFLISNRSLSAEEVRASHLRLVPGTDPTLTLRWALDEGPPAPYARNSAMATAGRYDSPIAGKLLWDFPGLFARVIAGSRELAVQSRAAVVSPNVWTHYTTIYDTNFGIRLRGGDFGDCGTDDSLNVQDALSIEAWVVPDERPAGEEQVIFGKFGRDAAAQAYEMGLDRFGRPYLLVRVQGETDDAGHELPENEKLHRFTAPTPLPLDVASYVVGTLEFVELTDTTQNQNCTSVVGQIYIDGVPQLPGPARPDVSASTGVETYTVSVLGGTGTGRYRPGDTVRIAAANAATFTQWYADADVLAQNVRLPALTFTMPARDVTVTAIGVLDAINITQSGAPANIGRTATDQQVGRSYFRGRISELQVWSEALEPRIIAAAYGTHRPAPPGDGLLSAWSFSEQSGRIAYDSHFKNDALLSGSELWVTVHENARMQLLLDGEPLDTEIVPWTRFGTYGPRQVRFGGQLDDLGVSRNNLVGTIDEIRLWNGLRTLEQIRDSMHRTLAGNEDHLLGYWRFDAGSGRTVVDGTGMGNDACFVASTPATSPIWVRSDAPVSNEAAPVLNALGGLVTSSVARITEGPTAFEYADSQRDSAGELFSVLKRGYVYHTATAGLAQITGYKIGDLKQVYLGQVQTKPTLIGFIEGAPPLPSENLTRPYYADATSITEYAGIGSVKLTDSETQTVTFAASRQDGRKIAFDLAFSGGGGIQKGDIIGLPGYGVEIQTTKIAGKLGAKFQLEWSDSSTQGAGLSSAALSADANGVTSGGNWEEHDTSGRGYLIGERRYIPSNEGYALVKSMTADMYSLHLEGTGALVSLIVVPNLTIPQDVNVISFPINPRYVKNGTLDGKVGLANDPDWPHANVDPGSYFRPAEAYALKNKIDRETSQLLAYYRQFDAVQRGKAQNADLSDAIAGNPFFDWNAMLPKKDLVNSYVWSASGGMYSEQESTTNTRQESYAGSYSFSWALGPTGSLQFELFGISFELEANLSGGTSWTVNVSKEQKDDTSMGLDVSVSPDRMLRKYLGPPEPFYSRDPAAGKVQSYRFMTFYLAPRPDNARDFFTKIVDQRWLRMSLDPAAAALLDAEAAGADNPVWRILHRVTFVSRVPPQFQVQPAESVPVDVVEPAHTGHNALMIELVKKAIGTREPAPSIVGAAVRTVVTGDLVHVVPWWEAYLARAAEPNSAEARNLERILDASIRYMTRYYESSKGIS